MSVWCVVLLVPLPQRAPAHFILVFLQIYVGLNSASLTWGAGRGAFWGANSAWKFWAPAEAVPPPKPSSDKKIPAAEGEEAAEPKEAFLDATFTRPDI